MKMLEDLSARTRGSLEFAIAFSKYKKGGYIVREILTDCTYSYVDKLFDALVSTILDKNVEKK